MRKLVTIRTISNISPIDGADAIEVATVDGWQVVVKKGEFKVCDQCVYFEIDSFLPDGNSAWQFLVDKHPREFEGRRGHRLRSIKLRGTLSQGFIVPLHNLPAVKTALSLESSAWATSPLESRGEFNPSNIDFSDVLGVVKWEAPIPAELAGQVEGPFPSFIPKTDQERCQNLINEIFVENLDSEYEVSMKLDGTSCTIYHNNGKFGVCSRNWELKINDENKHNTLVRIAHDTLLNAELPRLGNYAIQGELMGPGIQGNREGLKQHELFIFDIYNIDEQRYLTPKERMSFVDELQRRTMCGAGRLWHVPLLDDSGVFNTDPLADRSPKTLPLLGIGNVKQLLDFAEGPSLTHKIREGLVFKRTDGKFSFKAISNLFLVKEE